MIALVTEAKRRKPPVEHMRQIGAKGGRVSGRKKGVEFMTRISALGVAKRQQIIAAGKKALEKENGGSPT